MARTHERLAVARRALGTLRAVLAEPDVSDITVSDITVSDIIRDAAIQRFEYTFEATWKAAQQYLRDLEGLETASPRATVRASLQVGLLGEPTAKRALTMVDDRNLSVHTYNEALAETLFARLAGHAEALKVWLDALERAASEPPGETPEDV